MLSACTGFGVDPEFPISELIRLRKAKQEKRKIVSTMNGSYNETIERLEGDLREVECELLYLISDLQVDDAVRSSAKRLEFARHCVSAAAKALRLEAPAELVDA